MDLAGKTVHFIGIGGIGVSALAQLAKNTGAIVSGCDNNANRQTHALQDLGITIDIGHHLEHVKDKDIIVYSSAIKADHPELLAAGSRAVRRGKFLAELVADEKVLAVIGSHGKSTTTWLLAQFMLSLGFDPTILLGGTVPQLGGNFRRGGVGCPWIIEVDESDKTFLEFNPALTIVTNIDTSGDHLDNYLTASSYHLAFALYIDRCLQAGKQVIINADDVTSQQIAQYLPQQNLYRFGLKSEADFRAANIVVNTKLQSFALNISSRLRQNSHLPDQIQVDQFFLTGQHNIYNCLAAWLGVTLYAQAETVKINKVYWQTIIQSLTGVEGRLQFIEKTKNISVYIDYAHHPAEIVAVINAVKQLRPNRLITVFEPHLYSRTERLCQQFGSALSLSDLVILVDIYPAREQPIPGVTSDIIGEEINKSGGIALPAVKLSYMPELVARNVTDGTIVLLLGAGTINASGAAVVEAIKTGC